MVTDCKLLMLFVGFLCTLASAEDRSSQSRISMGLTKIAAPRLRNVVPRDRLFSLLDEMEIFPVTWISSVAGSGKTTLLASYLETRGIPSLWYRVDEADSDAASFFYYMSEAGRRFRKGRNKPLPLLSSEYRPGMFAFTRHYFESLFLRMPLPFALVFDNYQDAPENSEFHEVIKNGLRLVPEGVRVFVASRNQPPPPLVSLKADSLLASLGWDHVRLTLEEVRELMRRRGKGPVSEETVRRVYEETKGWAAAVVLFMDEGEMPPVAPASLGQSSVFNYIAVEVFRKLDERKKNFLRTTALLPSISPEIASELTGVEESASLLAYLSRNHFFIDRKGTEYVYHPLFREFLLEQGREFHDPEGLFSLRVKAARVLARSSRIEEAAELLKGTGAHRELLQLILENADKLLAQGRSATLEEWTERLPEEMRRTDPWLAYWRGMGRLVVDSRESKLLFEEAFHLFESKGDKIGCLLSAAGIINSINLEWDDYRPGDRWIEWIERNVDPDKSLPSPEIEAQVASAMVLGITGRMFWHPAIGKWIGRALEASRLVKDLSIRCTVKAHVMEHHGIMGHWQEMRLVADELRQLTSSPSAPPLVQLAYLFRVLETHDFLRSSWEEAFGRLQKAIQLAEEIGAHFHFSMIYLHGVWIAFEMKNLQLAEEMLRNMELSGATNKKMGTMFYHELKALHCMQTGDLVTALREASDAVQASVATGAYIHEAYARTTFSYVLRRMGRVEEARRQLEKAEEIIRPAGISYALYLVRLTQASLSLDMNDRRGAAAALRDAFAIGKEKGYEVTLFKFWQPDEMARLCAEALDADIEVNYAREVITRNELVPQGPPETLDRWPWLVRIRTFGSFEIEVSGKAVVSTRKVQKKPLALLRAIISLGGRRVNAERLEDLLWPEAEGDAAHVALKSAVSRLRRLLGNERAVEVREGMVSLNSKVVRLDTWVLESLAERISRAYRSAGPERSAEDVKYLSSLVLDFYRGDFLGGTDDPWAGYYRRRARSLFTKTVEKLKDMLNRGGRAAEAIRFYEMACERGAKQEAEKG